MLADGVFIDRRECQARDFLWCSSALHEEREAGAVALALAILVNVAVGADPVLLPLLELGVVGVETLPPPAPGSRPVLENRAAVAGCLDDAVTAGRAGFGG